MDLRFSVYFMAISSFVIQYIFMSLMMTNSYRNITFSLGKFYMSSIMALTMVFVEVLMNDIHFGTININYYLAIIFLLVAFIYLYRNQMYIDDKEYLKEMIEHHSMALLTSEEILQKTHTENVKKLAENIVETQEKEIECMNYLLTNL